VSEDGFFIIELFDLYVGLSDVVQFDAAVLFEVVLFGYVYFINVGLSDVVQFDAAVLFEVVLFGYVYFISYFFRFLWKSFCFGQRFLQVAQRFHFLLFVVLLHLFDYDVFGKFDWLDFGKFDWLDFGKFDWLEAKT